MGLLKRLGWYLGGFSIGLIFLAFFLKKKKAEFCYGIDCRILKNIRSKDIVFSDLAEESVYRAALDSITLYGILHEADVDISKSNTKLDSCKVYFVEGTLKEKPIYLTIENCSKIATIQKISLE
jgi:hypothetical protein